MSGDTTEREKEVARNISYQRGYDLGQSLRSDMDNHGFVIGFVAGVALMLFLTFVL